MKKLISLLATVAMVSTLFVSVVKADFAPTVISEKEQLTNDAFKDLLDEDIPEGYDAYLVTVSFANLGDLDCTIKTKKHSGRKLQGFGYALTFDDIDNVETDYVLSVDNVFGVDLSEGFDGNTFTTIFNAGSASAAYPTSAGTISNAEGIEDAVTLLVVVKSDATVVATLNTNMKMVTYSSNTPGEEESTNYATMSPTSLTFAAAPTTYTYTFKTADGTADIDVQSGLAAGAAVTAPTAPTIAGKDFAGWATSVGGAAVTVDTTASADKTYYAVYVDAAPAYEKVDPDNTQAAKVVDKDAGTYTNYSGDSVTLTKNYAIARFNTAIDGAKTYKLHASSVSENKAQDYEITSFAGIEAAGLANFVAIIKGAPTDTVMELRAFDK